MVGQEWPETRSAPRGRGLCLYVCLRGGGLRGGMQCAGNGGFRLFLPGRECSPRGVGPDSTGGRVTEVGCETVDDGFERLTWLSEQNLAMLLVTVGATGDDPVCAAEGVLELEDGLLSIQGVLELGGRLGQPC
jgi:hypothetical protein